MIINTLKKKKTARVAQRETYLHYSTRKSLFGNIVYATIAIL